MRAEFTNNFGKDLRAIKDKGLRRRAQEFVEEVERASDLQDLHGLKRLKGGVNCFRYRIGDYRIALTIEGDVVTFVRFLNRNEIYRYFP